MGQTGSSAVALQENRHLLRELVNVDRLGDVPDAAHLQRLLLVPFHVGCRQRSEHIAPACSTAAASDISRLGRPCWQGQRADSKHHTKPGDHHESQVERESREHRRWRRKALIQSLTREYRQPQRQRLTIIRLRSPRRPLPAAIPPPAARPLPPTGCLQAAFMGVFRGRRKGRFSECGGGGR